MIVITHSGTSGVATAVNSVAIAASVTTEAYSQLGGMPSTAAISACAVKARNVRSLIGPERLAVAPGTI